MRRRRRRARGVRSTADLASSHLASSRSRSRCEPKSREIAPTRKTAPPPTEFWLTGDIAARYTGRGAALVDEHTHLASWRALDLLPPDSRWTTFPRRPGGSDFLPQARHGPSRHSRCPRRLIAVPIGSVPSLCAHRTDTRLLSRSQSRTRNYNVALTLHHPHSFQLHHPHSFQHVRCWCMCVCAQLSARTRPMLAKLLAVCLLASTSAFAPPASIASRTVAKPLVTSRGPTIEMMPTWQKQGKLFQIPHQSTGENPDTEVLPPAHRTHPRPGQRQAPHGLRRCSISSTCSASRRS